MEEQHRLAEAIERKALSELHEAAGEALRGSLGLELRQLDGALASLAAKESSIVVNRAIGLGHQEPASAESVRALVECYARAGIARYFVHLHEAAQPAALREWLAEAGLERRRRWMKFVRGREAVARRETALRIEKIGADWAADFGRIVAQAFDLSEAAAPWLAGLVERPGWHLYLSFAGEEPAGAGALFVDDGVGWLDWGATWPRYRRQGSQGALLARRVQDALDLGCRVLFTTTGEAVEGDPQHSYRNIQRAGFRESYLRDNYAPA